MSAAADTFQIGQVAGELNGAPQRRQRRVDLESIAQYDDALGRVGALAAAIEAAELVVVEAASRGGHKSVSGC